jgi:hypothetical protein
VDPTNFFASISQVAGTVQNEYTFINPTFSNRKETKLEVVKNVTLKLLPIPPERSENESSEDL